MKAQYAIELLTKYYKPDDELFVTWWDKNSAEQFTDNPIPDSQWEYIAGQLEDDEWYITGVNETIAQMISEGEGL
jgi:hypothetical protein